MPNDTGQDPTTEESTTDSDDVRLTSHTSSTWKVLGEIDAADGTGVLGHNTSTSGQSMGVMGVTDSGETGAAGVRGESKANDTIGVSGYNLADPANEYSSTFSAGVFGDTDRQNEFGVFGVNTNTGGSISIGVLGRTSSSDGAGVFGFNTQGGVAVEANGRLRADEQIAQTASDGGPQSHVASIVNTETGITSNVLSLKVGNTGDPVAGNNFVTFYNGNDNAVGAIEGDGSGGVTLDSGTADFAEYLPRLDPDEELREGDVVGVFGNAITRRTDGAQRVMVVSGTPIVTGNSPGTEDRDDHETVAFTGQVSVRLRGSVDAGDVIVPSGEADGTAIALAPEEWSPGTKMVGQAWESDDTPGISSVTVAVGIDDPAILGNALSMYTDRIDELEAENDRLRDRLGSVEDRIANLETGQTPETPADD